MCIKGVCPSRAFLLLDDNKHRQHNTVSLSTYNYYLAHLLLTQTTKTARRSNTNPTDIMTASTCCRKGENTCVCSKSNPNFQHPIPSILDPLLLNCLSTHPFQSPPSTSTPTQTNNPPVQQATCSCGKQSALNCTCSAAPAENTITGPTCSCGARPVGKCTCNNASSENESPKGPTCMCGARPCGE